MVLRSNQSLLAGFHPSKPAEDFGLDSVYVWPGGEIWFSTETDFQDLQLGTVSAGDLLSDQGYIVLRQAELLNAFAPTQNPPAFGLDALYVVTDASAAAAPPNLAIHVNASRRGVGLTWQGEGRVFQVDRAGVVTGPFQPLSPLLPDLLFDDSGALTNRTQSYYRLRQW
jgi:hypothetical protein